MNAGMLVPNLPRGGPRTKKLTDDQILEIQSWIDEDCTITLSEIKGRILWDMLIEVSESTVSNYIKSFHYTFKRVARIANAADTPELWIERNLYCQWYTENKVLGKTFIYLDEVGFQVIIFKFTYILLKC